MSLTISIIANVILLLIIVYLVVIYKRKVKVLESNIKELELELSEFKKDNKKKPKGISFKEKISAAVSIIKTAITIAAVIKKMK